MEREIRGKEREKGEREKLCGGKEREEHNCGGGREGSILSS
jgi:hypothetical protein